MLTRSQFAIKDFNGFHFPLFHHFSEQKGLHIWKTRCVTCRAYPEKKTYDGSKLLAGLIFHFSCLEFNIGCSINRYCLLEKCYLLDEQKSCFHHNKRKNLNISNRTFFKYYIQYLFFFSLFGYISWFHHVYFSFLCTKSVSCCVHMRVWRKQKSSLFKSDEKNIFFEAMNNLLGRDVYII